MVFDDMTDEEIIAMTQDETQPAIRRMAAWLHSSDGNEIYQIMHDVVADCDAYEARIAELEAELNIERITAHDTAALSREWADAAGNLSIELARVRAESLRVVPVGVRRRIQDVDERAYFIDDDGDLDFVDEGSVYVFPDTIVQPVCLERWEDEG